MASLSLWGVEWLYALAGLRRRLRRFDLPTEGGKLTGDQAANALVDATSELTRPDNHSSKLCSE
jgi:hypothetical protein